jgi:membrane associated rhomboid family serine protease
VITLIHGTFGRTATWTLEGSRLRTQLQRHVGPAVRIECFSWSGDNSHAARLQASLDLAEHQRRLFERYPNATYSIVAHSHGGNVACYALRDETVRARLSSLVTIGTPFIICVPRRTPESVTALKFIAADLLAIATGLIVGIIGVVAALWLAPFRAGANSVTVMQIGVWGLAAVTPFVAMVKLAQRLPRVMETYYQALMHRQARVQARLALPRLGHVRLLSLAVRGDEAERYLQFLVHVANLPSLLFRRIDGLLNGVFDGEFTSEYAADRLITYVFLVLAPVVLPLFMFLGFVYANFETRDIARVILQVNVGWVLLIPLALLIAAMTTQLLMVTLPRLVRSHRLGFGGESLIDNWLTHIAVEIAPERAFVQDAANCAFVRLRPRQLGDVPRRSLSHSGLCESVIVADTIGAWLAGAPLAPSVKHERPSLRSRVAWAVAATMPDTTTAAGARTVVYRLLALNGLVFFIVQPLWETAAGRDTTMWLFGLHPDATVWTYYVNQFSNPSWSGIVDGPEWQWGPLTYMWVYSSTWSFLLPLWLLFAFGCGLEQRQGGGVLAASYIGGGLGAGALLILSEMLLVLPLEHDGPVHGAAGASLAVTASCALLAPTHRVCRGVPVAARHLAPVIAVVFVGHLWLAQRRHGVMLATAGIVAGAAYALVRLARTRGTRDSHPHRHPDHAQRTA